MAAMAASIRQAATGAREATAAAWEFFSAVYQSQMALVLFFCSDDYDLEILGAELRRLFAGVPVVGCTAMGEIGPSGYMEHGISGASFAQCDFAAVAGRMDGLSNFQPEAGFDLARKLQMQLQEHTQAADDSNSFALLLIDGLSMREEKVTFTLQSALDRIPLIGGSAGGSLLHSRAHVYVDGFFRQDAAAVVLLSTPLEVVTLKEQHFEATSQRMVITAADSARRIVFEINGRPAAAEYAHLLGVRVDELCPEVFAASPVVVLLGGSNYVRAIQTANPDGSLSFYCAIEEGVVLRLAHGDDLIENLERAMAKVRSEVGLPQLVIAFDCLLRKLELERKGQEVEGGRILSQNNACGFSSFGEQFRGVHINQTLTGIAIGSARRRRN